MITFLTDHKNDLIAYVIGSFILCIVLEATIEIQSFYYWKYIFMLPFLVCLCFVFFSQYVTDNGEYMKMKFFWMFCFCGIATSFIINKIL
jgi:hypothetical protein